MLRLWAFLTVLFIVYGAWMVTAAPDGARLVMGIPFVFWVLLFAWLTVRAWRSRPKQIVRTHLYPTVR